MDFTSRGIKDFPKYSGLCEQPPIGYIHSITTKNLLGRVLGIKLSFGGYLIQYDDLLYLRSNISMIFHYNVDIKIIRTMKESGMNLNNIQECFMKCLNVHERLKYEGNIFSFSRMMLK